MSGVPCLHFDCSNRNSFGYCQTTVCINDDYRYEECMRILAQRKVVCGDGSPRKGRVVPGNNPFTGKCSVCGASLNVRWNFCPNCGAKMEEDNG